MSKLISACVFFTLVLFAPPTTWGQAVLSQGQIEFIELGFDNSVPSNPEWIVQIFNESTLQTYDPAFNSGLGRWVFGNPNGAVFRVAGSQHQWIRPVDGVWNFTGANAGALFFATPQNGDPGTRLIMGVSTLGLSSGIFVNDQITITLSLVGITNPGHFSVYNNDDQFNNALGVLGAVRLSTFNDQLFFTRQSGSQNNFNLAFSQPGEYAIDFQFSGTREPSAGGGLVVSDFYRHSFSVVGIPEPTTWALLGLSASCALGLIWHRTRRRNQTLSRELEVP